ncbi:MAG TPA: CdaR family protein [Candidatus Binatia bacterium]|nr:CdaR family protein [Candidatus Binatia bacterium]
MRLLALRARPAETPPSDALPGPPAPVPPWRRLRLPRPRELRDALRRNTGLKLLSLVLAILAWVSVNVQGGGAERELELNVETLRKPPDLVVSNPPRPVKVTIRGPRTILDQVDERREKIMLDFSRATPGDVRIDLKQEMIRPSLQGRLSVVRMEPARLKIRLERLVRRAVPVHADLAGTPAFGYTVAESHVTPAQVEVTGPASKVDDLKEITTEPIDLRGLSESFQRQALLTWAGDLLNFAPDRVTVAITIEPVIVVREFKHVDVTVRNAGDVRAHIVPESVDIAIRGPQHLLKNYKLTDGQVYVDAKGLEPGAHRVPVKVDLAPPLELTRQQPEMVTLQLGRPAR